MVFSVAQYCLAFCRALSRVLLSNRSRCCRALAALVSSGAVEDPTHGRPIPETTPPRGKAAVLQLLGDAAVTQPLAAEMNDRRQHLGVEGSPGFTVDPSRGMGSQCGST
jgi:hypothetical protein